MSGKRNFGALNVDLRVDDDDLRANSTMDELLQSQSESQNDKENDQPESQSADDNQRAKRSRKQTDRFGLTEEEQNDDSLFDEIDKDTSSKEATDTDVTTQKSDTQQSVCVDPPPSQLTSGEQIILEKLIEVSTHVKMFQKAVVNMELRLEKAEGETHNLNSVDDALLLEIGLPLTQEEQIVDFNNKLKKKSFWSIVVGVFDI